MILQLDQRQSAVPSALLLPLSPPLRFLSLTKRRVWVAFLFLPALAVPGQAVIPSLHINDINTLHVDEQYQVADG